MIGRIIALLWNTGNGESEQLRWTLIAVFGATILGIVPILVFSPSVEVSIYWTLAPWLFTAYRLFAIRRFINAHLTGEALEALQALVSSMNNAVSPVAAATIPPATTAVNQEATGIFDNPLIRTYLSITSVIFLVQTVLFLMLPLYVNYTVGGIAMIVLIAMLLTVIAIDNFTSFKKLSRFTVKISVIAYSVGLIFVLFPHVSFYLDGITSKVNMVSMSTAKKANNITAMRKKQQEDIINKYLDEVAEWQKANPGEKPPKEFEEAMTRARQLKMMKSPG